MSIGSTFTLKRCLSIMLLANIILIIFYILCIQPQTTVIMSLPADNLNQIDETIDFKDLYLKLERSSKMAHVIADSKHKILCCRIPKNGSTMLKILFDILFNQNQFGYWHHNRKRFMRVHYLLNKSLNIYHGYSNYSAFDKSETNALKIYSDILYDDQWKKLVVIRDPLERLLSAYLDPFDRWSKRLNSSTVDFISFVVKHFLPNLKKWEKNGTYAAEPFYTKENHFSPQYAYCNLEKVYKRYYTDTIFYNIDTFDYDIQSFLTKTDIAKNELEWYYKWGTYHNETIFGSQSTQHSTAKYHNHTQLKKLASFYKKYYHNKEFALYVMSLFEKDYNLFNIPYPKWIDFL